VPHGVDHRSSRLPERVECGGTNLPKAEAGS
jgi:hypothetical protein